MPVLSSLSGHEVSDIAQAAVGPRYGFAQRRTVQGSDAADSLDRVRRKAAGFDDGASAVRRPVDVHAYAERVVIRQDGRIVAEHPRRYGRGATIYDPWHYVPVLARKPDAHRVFVVVEPDEAGLQDRDRHTSIALPFRCRATHSIEAESKDARGYLQTERSAPTRPAVYWHPAVKSRGNNSFGKNVRYVVKQSRRARRRMWTEARDASSP
jgi:hypothetical protein